jgi:hypothetical protein
VSPCADKEGAVSDQGPKSSWDTGSTDDTPTPNGDDLPLPPPPPAPSSSEDEDEGKGDLPSDELPSPFPPPPPAPDTSEFATDSLPRDDIPSLDEAFGPGELGVPPEPVAPESSATDAPLDEPDPWEELTSSPPGTSSLTEDVDLLAELEAEDDASDTEGAAGETVPVEPDPFPPIPDPLPEPPPSPEPDPQPEPVADLGSGEVPLQMPNPTPPWPTAATDEPSLPAPPLSPPTADVESAWQSPVQPSAPPVEAPLPSPPPAPAVPAAPPAPPAPPPPPAPPAPPGAPPAQPYGAPPAPPSDPYGAPAQLYGAAAAAPPADAYGAPAAPPAPPAAPYGAAPAQPYGAPPAQPMPPQPVQPGPYGAPPSGPYGAYGTPGMAQPQPMGPAPMPQLMDPHAIGQAVARLGSKAKRDGKVAFAVMSAVLEEGDVVEIVVQGRVRGVPGVAALVGSKLVFVNERWWKPEVVVMPITSGLQVQGLQDDRSATVVVSEANRQEVIELISDKLIAVEFAHRVRDRTAAISAQTAFGEGHAEPH